ncbi:transposase [Ensifer sp. SL37]|uniref:transposase n=1 Tax=Ensifer sp. SL37 TaxID=2995137 RepID=UPI003FA39450
MELTDWQYALLFPLLPVQRGNVKIDNRQLLNALLYIAENGCKWRRLPKEYGNWHTIHTRLCRWAEQGVLERIFEALQRQRLIAIRIEWMLWPKMGDEADQAARWSGVVVSATPSVNLTPPMTFGN